MAYSRVTISSPDGRTAAEFVPEANMVCCSLRHGADELLDPGHGLEAYAERGKTMGIPLLHPWANRLAGCSYAAAGKTVSLPDAAGRYGLDPNGLPIHGALPGRLRWDVDADGTASRVIARLAWESPELRELFPFAHELVFEADVAPGELTVTTTLRATGADVVPVSFGFHPYLTIPGGSREQWQVSLGAAERLVLDDRMIPTGERTPLAERDFALRDQSWDDSLDGLDDPARFMVASDRVGLTMTFEEGFRYAQVYAPPEQNYICFEPMTAPTNALRSGAGLVLVAPGEQHRTRFVVRVRP